MVADYEQKTVKRFLMELAMARIQEMEKKGILPKKVYSFGVNTLY